MSALPPILIIDHNDDDLYFARRLLGKGGVKNPIITFDRVPEVMSFLCAATQQPDTGLVPCAPPSFPRRKSWPLLCVPETSHAAAG